MKSISKAVLLLLVTVTAHVVAQPASALVRNIGTVKATTGLKAWNTAFQKRVQAMQQKNAYPTTGYTECAETEEIAGAVLCVSNDQIEMNLAFARISAYVEGLNGIPRHTVARHDRRELRALHSMIGGHDLKEQDVVEFLRASQTGCRTDKSVCLNENEKEIFKTVILPSFYKNKKAGKTTGLVVITYAIQSSMEYLDVVTHEILHAQYFLQPGFKEIVDAYWNDKLTEAEKKRIRSTLGRTYNANDEFLMKNEFQAYILMANAEQSELGPVVKRYRPDLVKALAERGLAPLQIR